VPLVTEYGDIVIGAVDEWGRRRINGVLEDGTIIIIRVFEYIIANNFPMIYILKPVKAMELVSKVENVKVKYVSMDFPQHLLKEGKAGELRSKFSY